MTLICRSSRKLVVSCHFFLFFLGSTCDQPTSPHGSVIIHPTQREKYQNGQVILFGCKQGFYLDGMPIITCNGNKWTQTQFRCLGMTQLNSLSNKTKRSITKDRHCLVVLHFTVIFGDSCKNMFACQTQFQFQEMSLIITTETKRVLK